MRAPVATFSGGVRPDLAVHGESLPRSNPETSINVRWQARSFHESVGKTEPASATGRRIVCRAGNGCAFGLGRRAPGLPKTGDRSGDAHDAANIAEAAITLRARRHG